MDMLVNPLYRVFWCFGLAGMLVPVLERTMLPREIVASAHEEGRADLFACLAARLALLFVVFGFYFAISWRPYYALAGTLSFYAVFAAISCGKHRFVREPLVFTDIALLPALLRHKELFYASFLGIGFWAVSLTYVIGATTAFFLFEPAILPPYDRVLLVFAGLALAVAPWVSLAFAPVRCKASRLAGELLGSALPEPSTRRFGAFTYVILHFVSWLGFTSKGAVAERATALEVLPNSPDAPPVIVIWQSESFYDLRRIGHRRLSLPNLDALRERAERWGPLTSVFDGGYTMRTEFATIAGVAPAEMGPRSYHPYLQSSYYAASAWPTAFRSAGWSTTFIHPYDSQFFRRHKAIPDLGFEKFIALEAFEAPSGTYVSDRSLSDRVLDICRAGATKPQFVFVASMENHGPWKRGRAGDIDDATAIYSRILESSDAALGHLISGLDAVERPVWLGFYGDHPPLLPSFPRGFPDPRTDYVLVASGTAARNGEPKHMELQPWLLLEELVGCAGRRGAIVECQ